VTERWGPFFSGFRGGAPSAEVRICRVCPFWVALTDWNVELRSRPRYDKPLSKVFLTLTAEYALYV
jgi:hypothetical protein